MKVADRLSELGAEDGDALLTLEDLGLTGQHEMVNAAPPAIAERLRRGCPLCE